MPTTLTNGIQLPDKGSVDWYSSMQSNYNLIDTHLGDTDIHVTAEDKANWDSKQGSLSQDQLDAIAQVAINTSDISALQSGKANASHTHSSSDITDIGDYATKDYVDNSISDLVDNAPDALNTLNELSAALNDDSNFATTVTNALANKADSADLATVATSGSYTDLSNKPTINNSTITIQKNGSTVDTFTTNGSAKTIDIPVPTKTSDLTNDSNFVDTSNSAVSSGITSAKVTDYDTHIADTDIHVTTADKNKWNNQTYVLRYSSTALTASSTNSNALLDNTDNLKVGDKVIDSSGNIYVVTAIDTANSTFTIGTSLIDLAQDSDVVHKSGDETIAGIKSFSDDTYIKSLNFTNEVASPSSSGSAVMPIVTTVTYTDSSPSQSARLNFRITADGIKSLYPHENNQYALGLQSRKWSEVRATQYYYGSTDTEFSDKFVTVDTAQTITSNKTFVGSQYFKDNNVQYFGIDFSKGTAPSAYTARCTYFSPLTGGGSTYQSSNGLIGCAVNNDNVVTTFMHAIKNTAGITTRTSFVLYYDTDNDKRSVTTNGDFLPILSGQGIGNSTSKWSTINGLEPSALGMPDLSNGIDISSYLDTSQSSQNYYTPTVDGWISIKGRSSTTSGIAIIQGDMAQPGYNLIDFGSGDRVTFCALPVIAGVQVEIWLKSITTLDSAKFFPCQGNV